MLRRLLLLLPLLPLLLATPLNGADFDPTRLAAIAPRMQQFVEEGVIAGAVTVVGNAQGIVQSRRGWLSDLESKQPLPKDAVFRIASMTKPITAIGIMQLAGRRQALGRRSGRKAPAGVQGADAGRASARASA